MNFNAGIKSISISKEAKKVFEELDSIRPKHISFSLMLAIAADEYVKQHNKGLVKLDDFNEDDYLEYIVDHKEARERALICYKSALD